MATTLTTFMPFGRRRSQGNIEVWTKHASYELERSRWIAAHRVGRNALALVLSGALGSLGGWTCDWIATQNYQADNHQTNAQVGICASDVYSQHTPSVTTDLPACCQAIAGRISHQREVLSYHDARSGQNTVQHDTTTYMFPSSISEFISDASIHPADIAHEQDLSQRLSTEVGAGTAAVVFFGLAGSLSLYARRETFTVHRQVA
ncbi:MAG TPA: hypothetical protein VHD60_00820 [Candidatus Saccharimonadales bacterium]|nr:hypothetical protein [Candidatus Saccharimonadales bacterium]